MDQNKRMLMNLGTDNRFAAENRPYPTTPSTFPQPVPGSVVAQSSQYQGGGGGGGAAGGEGYQTGAAGGYFSQPLGAYTPQQFPIPVVGSVKPHPDTQVRGITPGPDPSIGLAQQFSHQHLGNHAGSSQNNGQRAVHQGNNAVNHGNHLSSQTSRTGASGAFQAIPERNPERYGANANNNQKKCSQLATDFFKDSVKRARERNQRQSELEQKLSDPSTPTARRDQLWATAGRKEASYLRFLRTKDKPENYKTIKIIGRGAFGEVKLVQKKTDGKIYAMKSLIKTEMFKRDQLAHVRAERDILAESDSPWVVKLYTTFQDSGFLYMLMEFLPGGDLMTMLIKYEIFSEDITRFYMAELVLAIEEVHRLGFIHRDIKPDNILLDRGGHVKLTDFGLSTGFHKLHDNNYYQQLLQGKPKRPNGRNSVAIDQINLTVSNRSQINDWRRSRRLMAYSAVGTPDYIAPEIFERRGYSFDCDWWSLGTIMFECLVGWPPFCAEDSNDVYAKIVNWRHTLYFPEDITLGDDAASMIRSLIIDSDHRLGRGGAHEIKAHAFFRGVDFTTLRNIRAPFEPRLTSAIDTTYFPIDEIDQTENAALLKAQAMAGNRPLDQDESPELSLPFIGYTFKRFDNNFR